MKKSTLILLCYALVINFLSYMDINKIVFFIITIALSILCSVLIEKFVLRQIKIEAEEDHLTTLKNKRAYSKQIQFFNSCDSIGVLFLDINNLKITNNTYGHAAGDELIVSVAKVIKKYTTKGAFSYRFGGDEFVMIFTNINKEKFLSFNEILLKEFSKIKLEFSPLEVSVAIGQIYENNQIDIECLLKKADSSMYEAKNNMKAEK